MKQDKNTEKISKGNLLVNAIKKYISNIEELLNKTIDITKIEKLEVKSGKELPKDFKDIYSIYNGENEKVFGLMAGFKLLDIDSIIKIHNTLQNSAYEILSDKDNMIKEGSFQKAWIPFAEDGSGSFLVLDLDPGKKGSFGQVISIDRESNISYALAKSFSEFIQFINKAFEEGNLNIIEEEDVKVIQWKDGHLFDDVQAFSNTKVDNNTSYEVRGFWAEYFKDDIINGKISTEELIKRKMVFIKDDKAKEFKSISLDILKHMVNLKELIIHADNISSFEGLKELKSLKKLVIGSSSFKESDLEYLIDIEGLKELTLVNLNLNNISQLQNIKALKSLRLYKIGDFNSESLKYLKNLKDLSLEKVENIDLSYISYLKKLKKLELKEIEIPNLEFLQTLKKLTVFETDRKANSELGIEIFEEMTKLKELIYPIGNMEVIKNCINLREVGIDVPNIKNLNYLSSLGIERVNLYNAISEENAEETVKKIEKYCELTSYGWRQTWK